MTMLEAVTDILARCGSPERPFSVVAAPNTRFTFQVLVHAPNRTYLAGNITLDAYGVVLGTQGN